MGSGFFKMGGLVWYGGLAVRRDGLGGFVGVLHVGEWGVCMEKGILNFLCSGIGF